MDQKGGLDNNSGLTSHTSHNYLERLYVWPGRSWCLFSCSLHISCPTSTIFMYTVHTGLTFLRSCRSPQPVLAYQSGDEEHVPLLVSLVTNKSLTSISHSPWGQRLPPCPACHLWYTGCRSRTLLQMCKLPHPLNHRCLCCWLWALSLIVKLGNCRPCKPMEGCLTIYIT